MTLAYTQTAVPTLLDGTPRPGSPGRTPWFQQPEESDTARVYYSPVFTCAITAAATTDKVPLHPALDINLLKYLAAWVYAASLPSMNYTLSVRVGNDLDATGNIDTTAGKAWADLAAVIETSASNSLLFEGHPVVVLTAAVLATVITKTGSPRLGKYFQVMMTPGSTITGETDLNTKLYGYY